jgi:subtilase family serine protease
LSDTKVHIQVTLKVANSAALSSFLTSLSDKNSLNYRHFLTPKQFGQDFGPSLSEVAAVEAVLRSEGLHPGKLALDRLSIPITASASTIDRALHVNLVRYRLPTGRTVFTTLSAPKISASVAAHVEGVIGLNDLTSVHSMLVRASRPDSVHISRRMTAAHTTGPNACKTVADSGLGYTATELAEYYGMTPLYDLGDFGQGVRVAVVEFESDLASDIATYQACYGTHALVHYINVDGTGAGNASAGSGEASLDIEDILGFAPKATIDVYQGPAEADDDATLAVYQDIVNSDDDQIVSTGWGLCEQDTLGSGEAGLSFVQSEQQYFEQAAAQGQSVFAAAGDTGEASCYDDTGSPNVAALAVDDPASQPYVIGVGGTSIGATSETVWNDSTGAKGSGGAGGGGVSAVWCMPTYQDVPGMKGIINAHSVAYSGLSSCTSGYEREVPDVSADADPDTGYVMYWNHAWWGEGGTSAAAPLWAAAAALVDASPYCNYYDSAAVTGKLPKDATGTLYQTLYEIASLKSYSPFALYDITGGSNYYTPAGASGDPLKLYSASAGYDMASGLGSLTVAYSPNYYPGLAALTCGITARKLITTSIKRVSPTTGPASGKTVVKITGSGFLPIKDADMLKVGKKWVIASCKTTTSCTAALPATTAGKVHFEMSVEDMTLSKPSLAAQFVFVAAPRVTLIAPHRGRRSGGTRVVIRGANFVGHVTVRFGRRWATHVRLVSRTEIIAIAPAGKGVVDIYVSATGGTSATSHAAIYRY